VRGTEPAASYQPKRESRQALCAAFRYRLPSTPKLGKMIGACVRSTTPEEGE
jgi:hypothetical protein